ncbi:MAG: FHA domain-containing protein [Gemmatimonadaceae bacterium]|nr:FHA domain-containing protein [Gemmatimonadaceae bacterium]
MQHILQQLGIHLSTMTLVLLAAALVSVVGTVIIARRRRALARREPPPLVFAVRDRAPVRELRPAGFRAAPPPTSSFAAPFPPGPSPAERGGAGVAGAPVEDRTVRVPRYTEPAVEFLPGRLEIQSGAHRGETIRFVRPAAGGDAADVTLGRGDGPPDMHVKLPDETVSRHHARMQFENGRWKITNLSRTNPTILNGEELIAADSPRWLQDGDTIEMGDIVLRFRAP